MPLNEAESRQLQLLLAKANEPNVGAEDGDFTLVQGEVNRGWGAMTDGSKRREASNSGEPVLKRADKKAPSGYSMSPGMSPPWKLAPDGPMSSMDDPDLPHETGESVQSEGKILTLPQGVSSVEVWGKTLITCGRFKGANMSYEELWSNTDPSVVQYKQWCCARAFSLTGAMRDMSQYLLFMNGKSSSSQFSDGPIIPGSDVRRQYKTAK